MDKQSTKINQEHLDRLAYVYIRQSSPRQVVDHLESRRRQYELVEKIKNMGWHPSKIIVIDADQGKTGSKPDSRVGFRDTVRAVASGKVGVVAALEASRLARNSPDWSNLIFMCRYSQTLIVDEVTVYDPCDSNDRMVLGFRGQLAEMEVESSIERMVKARWSKAERGEFLIIPPAGFELDEFQQIVKSKDESVVESIQMIFRKFDDLGSARQVWQWFDKKGLKIPVKKRFRRYYPIEWCTVDYGKIMRVLKNPIFSGAYVFGKTTSTKIVDPNNPGQLISKTSSRTEGSILIKDHHSGYITFEKFEENQIKLRGNQAMKGNLERSGSVREGEALLQGIVRCGQCGRSMNVGYGGHKSSRPATVYQYRCMGSRPQVGGSGCGTVGGKRIDKIVVEAFFEVVSPLSFDVVKKLNDHIEDQTQSIKSYREIQIEKAEYDVLRAKRQYEAVDPENRLVARTLEKNWEECLKRLQEVRSSAEQDISSSLILEKHEIERMKIIGVDLKKIWAAKTTSNVDKKHLLHCLIDEVQLVKKDSIIEIKIVWKGGKATVETIKQLVGGQVNRTSEDDVELIKKLAVDFDDDQIARIMSRQGRSTARGNPYTMSSVHSIRGKHKIPKSKKKVDKTREGPFTMDEAARELKIAMSTVKEWLNSGLLEGEQLTPGAPWKIYLDDATRKKLKGGNAPEGWLGLTEASTYLGITKSMVSYLVKTGKIDAKRVSSGKKTVWKIDVKSYSNGQQKELFDQIGNTNI